MAVYELKECKMSWKCFKRCCFEWTVPEAVGTIHSPEFICKGKKFHLQFVSSLFTNAIDMTGENWEAVGVCAGSDDASLSNWWFRGKDTNNCVRIWKPAEIGQMFRKISDTPSHITFRVSFVDDEVELVESVPSTELSTEKKKKTKGTCTQLQKTQEKAVQTPAYMNNLPCLESLSEDLSRLVNHGPEPDIELTCGNLKVKAHRNILCTRSEVFQAMLNSDMAEKRTSTVDIQDMDQEVLDQFLKYLYSGKLPDLKLDHAKGLYEAADKYAVKALMTRCANFLVNSLDMENACDMLALADAHSDAVFKESAMGYVLQKGIYLKRGDRWSTFCKNHPLLALEVANHVFKHQAEK